MRQKKNSQSIIRIIQEKGIYVKCMHNNIIKFIKYNRIRLEYTQ